MSGQKFLGTLGARRAAERQARFAAVQASKSDEERLVNGTDLDEHIDLAQYHRQKVEAARAAVDLSARLAHADPIIRDEALIGFPIVAAGSKNFGDVRAEPSAEKSGTEQAAPQNGDAMVE
ncbi:MAG: hypothetical protein M1826_005540 [Phylliscum demangeonii]|nr:MAG: hypothetical protein M1826_005540 [Phylliscum demangeonii]